MAKAKATSGEHKINSRVYSGHDVQMYPQQASIQLQDLERSTVLTVGALSNPHCQFRALYWHHSISRELTYTAKSTLEI